MGMAARASLHWRGIRRFEKLLALPLFVRLIYLFVHRFDVLRGQFLSTVCPDHLRSRVLRLTFPSQIGRLLEVYQRKRYCRDDLILYLARVSQTRLPSRAHPNRTCTHSLIQYRFKAGCDRFLKEPILLLLGCPAGNGCWLRKPGLLLLNADEWPRCSARKRIEKATLRPGPSGSALREAILS
jgi:hypothetical protein